MRTASRAAGRLENLALIPGSVGASPVQNVGAYGVGTLGAFRVARRLDPDSGASLRLDAADCAFGYRDSVFKQATARPRDHHPASCSGCRCDGSRASTMRTWRRGCSAPAIDRRPRRTSSTRHRDPSRQAARSRGGRQRRQLLQESGGRRGRVRRVSADEPDAVGHVQPDGRVKLAAAWMIDRCGWRGRSLPGERTGRGARPAGAGARQSRRRDRARRAGARRRRSGTASQVASA